MKKLLRFFSKTDDPSVGNMASPLREGMLAVIINFCCVLSFAVSNGDANNLIQRTAVDPANATYLIEGQKVVL